LIYNAEEVHYPFTIHAPDRSTRGLPPLEEPWPMILNLGGSGARGDASLAETVSLGRLSITGCYLQLTFARSALRLRCYWSLH
jgi:hypothetical protein